jgi:hypothetical protein
MQGSMRMSDGLLKWWLEPELNRRHKDFQSLKMVYRWMTLCDGLT